LQKFVHGGHSNVFDVFERLLQIEQGATVLELGCGTGSIADSFLLHGYDYIGVDIDPERVAQARENAPQARFFLADLVNFDLSCVPDFQYCFIHGVLHHLNDDTCRQLLGALLPVGSNRRLAISEPVRPDHWWEHPARALLASLDEGKHVRTLGAWQQMLDCRLISLETRSLMPRWPMLKIDALLGSSESN
jgi:SAM-dependent methyltransferase